MRLPRARGTAAFLAAWMVPWKPVFRARTAQGLTFFAHRRDVSGRHIAKYGEREPDMTRWIAKQLAASPPGLFVDVGANIGWHSVHAAASPNVKAVVAFEPDPFNLHLLDRNLSANRADNVVIVAAALGERRGVVRLHRYKMSNSGRHSTLADYGLGSRSVPMLDLDGALSDLGFASTPVSVLKIDVEGGEPAVIKGAERTLTRTTAIVLEFSPPLSRAGSLSTDGLLDQLEGSGFAPFRILAGGALAPLETAALKRFNGQTDLVFMKR